MFIDDIAMSTWLFFAYCISDVVADEARSVKVARVCSRKIQRPQINTSRVLSTSLYPRLTAADSLSRSGDDGEVSFFFIATGTSRRIRRRRNSITAEERWPSLKQTRRRSRKVCSATRRLGRGALKSTLFGGFDKHRD